MNMNRKLITVEHLCNFYFNKKLFIVTLLTLSLVGHFMKLLPLTSSPTSVVWSVAKNKAVHSVRVSDNGIILGNYTAFGKKKVQKFHYIIGIGFGLKNHVDSRKVQNFWYNF